MRPSLASLAAPRGLLGSTLPQPILTPQLPPTPEGPVTAIRELGVPSLRPEGGGGAPTASCVCTPPRLMVQQELWGACVHSRTHRTAPEHRRARKPRSQVGGLGQTSDHHRGLVNFPPVPSASSAPRIIPPLGGSLMPGLLCGRGRVLRKCVEGT